MYSKSDTKSLADVMCWLFSHVTILRSFQRRSTKRASEAKNPIIKSNSDKIVVVQHVVRPCKTVLRYNSVSVVFFSPAHTDSFCRLVNVIKSNLQRRCCSFQFNWKSPNKLSASTITNTKNFRSFFFNGRILNAERYYLNKRIYRIFFVFFEFDISDFTSYCEIKLVMTFVCVSHWYQRGTFVSLLSHTHPHLF